MGNNKGESQRLITRLNEERYNIQGCLMKLIEYNNSNNILIEFQDEYKFIVHGAYREFKEGSIRNPYFRDVLNIGYVGNAKTKENGKSKRAYITWINMMKRCYDIKTQEKQPTYIGCITSDEWLCFANFEKWYNENYYEIDGEQMCLDKDILIKGNKIYSSKTCIFVSQTINKLFLKRNSTRGNSPIGVSYHKRDELYEAYCSVGKDKSKFLGYYKNKTDAFNAYKIFKENRIKEIADNNKDKIPTILYDVMYRYEVDITD